jgi:hypothetical protein
VDLFLPTSRAKRLALLPATSFIKVAMMLENPLSTEDLR